MLSTFSVLNTDDGGAGSLRRAILDANASAGPDLIDFNIAGNGLHVITPGTLGLPPITDPVTIDGYTQPGSSPNTIANGDSATLLIVLDGSVVGFADGLQLYAGNSTVRGLVINSFVIGITVASFGGNVIEGNFIGTDAAGLVALGNTDAGIAVRDSPGNTIGGTTPEARNVISGTVVSFRNTGQGIVITGPSSTGNLVQGNFIGTDATGTQSLGNGESGVLVSSQGLGGSASQTTIIGNVISGNAADGIEIVGGGNNLIAGNLIGTDVSGTMDLGNAMDGVVLNDTTDTGQLADTTGQNTMGGTTDAARNVISGNDRNGIAIVGAREVGNLVLGNYIGTNIHGQMDPGVDLGNSSDGVLITRNDAGGLAASNNRIGGTTAGERNVISGNHVDGVGLSGDSGLIGNLVQGNYIGTDYTGMVGLGNGRSGVRISFAVGSTDSASHNTIGGSQAGAGNLISANGESGVAIRGDLTGGTDNVVQGNFIGTDITGTVSLANPVGVSIAAGAFDNLIGGATAGADGVITPGVGSLFGQATPYAGNLISGNDASAGVDIRDVSTTGNVVQGNFIGTDLDGSVSLGNGNGVQISAGASENVIGGTEKGAGNLISGNDVGVGVVILDNGTKDNMVQGNFIGTSLDGSVSLGNANGVQISAGASENVIGGGEEGAGNVISGNVFDGIVIDGVDTTGNRVEGNTIGATSDASGPLGNRYGVVISGGATENVIGGTEPEMRNLISGNDDDDGGGVLIRDNGTKKNMVQGNYIGTDPAGSGSLPNKVGVVIFEGASENVIGGTEDGARNIISGNSFDGIAIDGVDTTANRVEGNTIGATSDASGPLGNRYGVVISGGATENVIGGMEEEMRNLISGNDVGDGVGVLIRDNGTKKNVVQGNYIGTNPAGSGSLPNKVGVVISEGASENVIGGIEDGARNVISGNVDTGVAIGGIGTMGNLLEGNYIGTDQAGAAPLPNSHGLRVELGASGNVIGGTEDGTANVISGNLFDGIAITDAGTVGNVVAGNFIGTDLLGTGPLANLLGVQVTAGAFGNVIGGIEDGARNVISGNIGIGIFINGAGTTSNRVQGNFIGVDAHGTDPLANGHGVVISGGASENVIGGATDDARNIISGNTSAGIDITDRFTTLNAVQGNYIGTDEEGLVPLPNPVGVNIEAGASRNEIGGTQDGAGNLISGNDIGVDITGADTTGNLVDGNYIGTEKNGNATLANTSSGIRIEAGASNNTIGGTEDAARNIISGNGSEGILIQNAATTNNLVEGNYIGTNQNGTASIPNQDGVAIVGSASQNMVGGFTMGAGNLISGNKFTGLTIAGAGTSGNQVVGNFIGTNPDGTAPLPNRVGVIISSGASQNLIGAPNEPVRSNVISGNTVGGILISDDGTTNNQVAGNFIGTNSDGSAALANNDYGVKIAMGAAGNEIGGTLPDGMGGKLPGGNLISGNRTVGVVIAGTGTTGNFVQDNRIGTRLDGNAPLPNGTGVSIESGASTNVIGGTGLGDGNVISGNSGANPGDGVGIAIGADTTGTLVQGNLIGTAKDGAAALGNASSGVRIEGNGNIVGGTVQGAGNVIAFNGGAGVAIFGTGNALEDNAIFSNAALGIDLGGDGVTANDPGDADNGANQLQNFPVLTSAFSSGNTTIIAGTLESAADRPFRIEFFASSVPDPTGFGQGQLFLGSAQVTTDSNGQANFTITLPIATAADAFLTATATAAGSNTSEFSQAAVQVLNVVIPSISIDDVTVTEGDSGTVNATFMVSLSVAVDRILTVDFATVSGTATAPVDYSALATTTLTFNPGETSKPVVVAVKGDTLEEGYETFIVQLSNPFSATLADARGLGTILNDDVAGTVGFDKGSFSVAADGGSITITVNRSGGSASGVTVDYATSDGTAHAGTDYTATAGTLTFGAGETRRTFSIPVFNDTLVNGDQTIILTLRNPTGGATLVGSSNGGPSVSLVSVNSAGTGSGNRGSFLFANPGKISADGRYITFISDASDLVANQQHRFRDVFVRDLLLGTTTLVSVNSSGTGGGGGNSSDPRISADGRFVLFTTLASDLVPGFGRGLYVRDLQMNTTEQVDVNSAGTGTGNAFFNPGFYFYDISANGRYVAFDSFASDLVANDYNGAAQDVFVRDMVTHTTTLVSVSSDATSGGNAQSDGPSLSADGRYVSFVSHASNLVSGITSSGLEVFVRDLQLERTALVSINPDGTASGGVNSLSAISADGRVVAFSRTASNRRPNDTNDLFVRDLAAGTTTLISVTSTPTGTPQSFDLILLNSDGRFVVFSSAASDLVADDTNRTEDVFLHDVIDGTTTLLSLNQAGTASGNSFSFARSISADGRFVTFDSSSSDLVANDTNGTNDAFVRDQVTGTTTLLSANRGGTGTANGDAGFAQLSADGSTIVFDSYAQDLVATDNNNLNDVFVAHLQAQSTAVLTIVPAAQNASAQISGVVFLDYNADSIQQPGEPGLPGRTIFLDANGNGMLDAGEVSAATGSSGNYRFTDLSAGAYTVRQVFQLDHGVVRTKANGFSYDETVAAGSDLTGRDFGNVLISQVSPVEVTATIFPPSPDDATAFVRGLYRNLLGRDAEAGGLEYWTALMKSGGNGLQIRAEVVDSIWKSPEHRGVQVDHYYETFLHRQADVGGRADWVRDFLTGANETDVVLGFVLSEEYRSAHVGDTAWVNELYKDVLSREAEPAGLASWINALKTASLSDVARAIVNSDESVLRAIDGYYSVFLHRAGEEAGRQSWFRLLRNRPDLVGAVGELFLSGDAQVAEYFAGAVARVP